MEEKLFENSAGIWATHSMSKLLKISHLKFSLRCRLIFEYLTQYFSNLEKKYNFQAENETSRSDFHPLWCDSVRLEAQDVDWSIISKSQFCISSIWQMNFSLAMNAIWREKSTWTTKARTPRYMIVTTTEKRSESVSAEKKKCVDSVTNKKYDVLFKR